MEYFKVVSCFNDMLVSYNLPDPDDRVFERLGYGVILEYKVGEWVRPKILGSNLFVYESLDQARFIAQDNYYPALVFRCEVENPSYEGYWTALSVNVNELRSKIQLKEKTDIRQYVSDCITRSMVFCDAVKLLEQV